MKTGGYKWQEGQLVVMQARGAHTFGILPVDMVTKKGYAVVENIRFDPKGRAYTSKHGLVDIRPAREDEIDSAIFLEKKKALIRAFGQPFDLEDLPMERLKSLVFLRELPLGLKIIAPPEIPSQLQKITEKLNEIQDQYLKACSAGGYEGPQFNEVLMTMADQIRDIQRSLVFWAGKEVSNGH